MQIRIAILAIALLCLGPRLGVCQEENTPWWNPFSKTSEATEDVRDSSFFETQEKKQSFFKMPEFPSMKLPSWGGSETKKSQPSAFSRMGSTTKRWWHSTVDFVNPFDDKIADKKTHGYQPQLLDEKSSKSSGFFNWFSQPEPEEPLSVNDFLSSPRPRF